MATGPDKNSVHRPHFARFHAPADGTDIAPVLVMASADSAPTTEIECVWTDHDIDTTVIVGPESHRRILAAAFAATADDEPTVRMRAPFPSVDVPSPLGDEAA